jgi:hypothetical protein
MVNAWMEVVCIPTMFALHRLLFLLFGGVWSVGVGRRYIGQANRYRLHCGHAFIVCLHLLSIHLVMLNIC